MENKEILATKNTQEEEVHVEIEDLDAGLTKEHVKQVREETHKKVIEDHVLSKEQQKLFKQMLKEADMSQVIKDAEMVLGKNELDIRQLSDKNFRQMMFRSQVISNIYLKQILTSLVDITRLLMIQCDIMGVEDIVGATDDIIEKINKQRNFKKTLQDAAKAEPKAKA